MAGPLSPNKMRGQAPQTELHLLFRILNVLCLGLGWALAMSGMFINISTSTLSATEWQGAMYSTVPVGAQVLCAALVVMPSARLAARYGRRVVFVSAALLAAAGACVMIAASYRTSYGLLIVGAFMQGPSFAVANNLRFVSAEFMTGPGLSSEWRSRAVSVTVGCAVLSAAIGPESVRHARNKLDASFAGAYVVLCGLYLAQALVSSCVQYKWLLQQQQQQQAGATQPNTELADSPSGTELKDTMVASTVELTIEVADDEKHTSKTSLPGLNGQSTQSSLTPLTSGSVASRLLRPDFLGPAVAGTLAFCNMAAIMVATPVSMKLDGHTSDMSTYVIEAHVVSMFLPAMLVGDWLGLFRALANMVPGPLQRLILLQPFTRPYADGSSSATFPDPAPQGVTMILGGLILLGGDMLCMTNRTMSHYMSGLSLVGLGWAFVYVTSSAMVTGIFTREPHLKVMVQGGMDTLVVLGMAGANALSGVLVRSMGWLKFVYLNIAMNCVLTTWCAAHHFLALHTWAKASAPIQ